MPKPKTLAHLTAELIAIVLSGARPSRACREKMSEIEAIIEARSESLRQRGAKARRHTISDETKAAILASPHNDGETARRLGLSRPTVAKWRKLLKTA